MFGRRKTPRTAAEMRGVLRKDSVPYYEIPSGDGHTALPDYIDLAEYEESAARALRLAREVTPTTHAPWDVDAEERAAEVIYERFTRAPWATASDEDRGVVMADARAVLAAARAGGGGADWDCSCVCSHLYEGECTETCRPARAGGGGVTAEQVREAGRRALTAYDAIPYDNDLTGEQVWDILGRAALGIEVQP